MGNVERFGLLALFVLCALIVGVGIFGSDATSAPKFEPAQLRRDVPVVPPATNKAWEQPSLASSPQASSPYDVGGSAAGGLRPALRPAPKPDRRSSFELAPLDVEPGTRPSQRDPGKRISNKRRSAKRPSKSRTYSAKPGDGLWRIAKNEMGSATKANIERLRQANPQIHGDVIRQGDKITIPAAGSLIPRKKSSSSKGRSKTRLAKGTRRITIRPNDSLWKIAKRELGSPSKKNIELIRRSNPSLKGDVVQAGRSLLLPVVAARDE